MEFVINTTKLVLTDWYRFLLGGIIVVCAIIVLEGILKKAFLGKVKNKLLRKVLLAMASLILVFPATALYFVSDNISFDYYWYGCVVVAILTIVGYWLYENTALREGIGFIGNKTIVKFATVLYYSVKNPERNIKADLYATNKELKKTVKDKLEKTDLGKL